MALTERPTTKVSGRRSHTFRYAFGPSIDNLPPQIQLYIAAICSQNCLIVQQNNPLESPEAIYLTFTYLCQSHSTQRLNIPIPPNHLTSSERPQQIWLLCSPRSLSPCWPLDSCQPWATQTQSKGATLPSSSTTMNSSTGTASIPNGCARTFSEEKSAVR